MNLLSPSSRKSILGGALTFGCGLIALLLAPSGAKADDSRDVSVVYEASHANGIDTVAFSPNGTQVMSGARDGILKLWDVGTGHLVRNFEQHKSDAYVIAFSPDGSRVLSESEDETMKLWDTTTGKVLYNLKDQSGVGPVSFSPDGAFFLSQDLISPGGKGIRRWSRKRLRDIAAFNANFPKTNVIRIWNTGTGRLVRTLPVQNHAHAVWFSPDGKQLTLVSQDFGVTEKTKFQVWDFTSGELVRTMASGDNCNADEGAFSPDGSLYAARSQDGAVGKFVLCDVTSGRALRWFGVEAVQVAFSPDGKHIVAGDVDGRVSVWETVTGKLTQAESRHSEEVHGVAFSPDGTKVISGSHDRTLKLWDAYTGQLLRTFGSASETVTSIAFSADGTRLVTGSWDGAVRLWDAVAGRLVNIFRGHSGWVNAVAFSPDGRLVASGSDDQTLKLWNAATGELIRTFTGHKDEIHAVAFSPDGTRLLSGGGNWLNKDDTTVKLWDVGSGKLLGTLQGHIDHISSVAFSPDGHRAVSGSFDHTIRLWDLSKGRLIRSFSHGKNDLAWSVTAVLLSSDGKKIASASEDGRIDVWDVAAGKLIRTMQHGRTVTSIAVSKDFTHLVSASGDSVDIGGEGTAGAGDRTLKLWDLSNGQLLRQFKGHSGGIKAVAMSPDGARLASASQDTTTKLWDAQTGEALVTLVAAEKDNWLAITPPGFYNSTRGGGDLLAVVRNAQVITIDQAQQSLFDPDLVRESIAGDPKGELRKAAKVINLATIIDSGPAPQVTITSHPLDSVSASDLVDVTAAVADQGKGVGRIEWRVNDITAAVTGSGRAGSITQNLALDPGTNVIEVIAYNGSNLLASVPARISISFAGNGDRLKGRLFVLAIGINAYAGGETPPSGADDLVFPPLTLAANDATAFGKEIARAAAPLYQDVSVRYALDANATKGKLESLMDALAKEVQPRDTFILFAAAHGTSLAGRFYLIPQDFRGGDDDLVRAGIGQDELQAWLARIRGKKALVLLDTCESGALVAGHSRARTNVPASEAAVGRLHEATGRPVLTAAAAGKPALEGYQNHGVFTWAVLDALHNGDSDGNGTIELSELVAYVETAVPKISEALNGQGRAAIGFAGVTRTSSRTYHQSAKFGSRGEDFTLVRKLQ